MSESIVRREGTRAIAVCLALSALSLGACAGKVSRRDIVFPPPPDPPRIRFIQTIRAEKDLDLPWWRRALGVLVPSSIDAIIPQPSALAISPDERTVYVAAARGRRVVAYDRERKSLRYIANDGSVAFPVGVAVDGTGAIYVVDQKEGKVVVYRPTGTVLREFGAGKLLLPSGIAIDRKNQLAYVLSGCTNTQGNHTVEVFSLTGDHLRTLGGGRGAEEGHFNFPSAVAVSPTGELFVSDMLNFRIQVFDPNGNFLRAFGKAGTGIPGVFDKIRRVAFDSGGRLYVLDFLQGVHILDDRLRPLMLFGKGFFQGPMDIAIDSKNTIFVADISYGLIELALINDAPAAQTPTSQPSAEPPSQGANPQAVPPPPAAK